MGEGKQATERTLERRLRILSALPDDQAVDGGMGVLRLTELLNTAGYPCDKRTVQRDMAAISQAGTVWRTLGVELLNGGGGPGVAARWRHALGSKMRFLSAISREQALMLSLMNRELQPFLPQSTYDDIERHVSGAEKVLGRHDSERHARFLQAIRVLPEAALRSMPPPAMAMLGRINDALLNGEQVELLYAGAKGERRYRLHPIGLVQQGLYHWLLAVKHEYTSERQLLSKVQSYRRDRMRSVTRLMHEPVARHLPTLDQALAAGRLEFFSGEPLALTLRFAATEQGAKLCGSFRDAPLGVGQVITYGADGGFELSTTIRHSLQLEWLLQRYADRIKVIEPAPLAEHLRKFARDAAAFQK